MKNFLILLLSLLILAPSIGAHNEVKVESEISELKDYLIKLDKKIDPKWEKYRGWQRNSEWLQNTVDLSLAGEIYNEGWFGPKISRQIVPDILGGWLVVDTVTIAPGLLMTAATLTGNILLNQVFPYIQAGPIKERTFVNVRKVKTYEEAVLARPFSLLKLPLEADAVDELEVEEQISTATTGGLYIRAGGGIAHLIGLELPAHVNIGPKSKVTFKGTLKLTVAKEENNHVLISVERVNEKSNGIGFGFGVFFEDIVDIPVTVGINSSNGYFPFLFNIKDTHKEIRSVVYDLDLNTPEGKKAYTSFLKRDFADIEELSEKRPNAVTMDIKKEGEIRSHEVNGMINLVLWRSGFRNIFVEGHFNTTDRAGNRFEYYELESEEITDKKWFSNREKTSLKFSALVPSSRHENGEIIEHRGGFVLDTHFFYDDTQTKGKEILEISDFLMESGTQMRLPLRVNKKHNYKRVQIDIKVRVQAEDMARFLNAPEEDIWQSLAYAQGLYDPSQYTSAQQRQRFVKEGRQGSQEDRQELMKKAQKVVEHLFDLKNLPTLKDRADKMIHFLKKGKEGQLLHKTLLDFIGKRKIMVRGFVRGKFL